MKHSFQNLIQGKKLVHSWMHLPDKLFPEMLGYKSTHSIRSRGIHRILHNNFKGWVLCYISQKSVYKDFMTKRNGIIEYQGSTNQDINKRDNNMLRNAGTNVIVCIQFEEGGEWFYSFGHRVKEYEMRNGELYFKIQVV
jgi:hypothetical protein